MPIPDKYDDYQTALNSPITGGFDIIPADGMDLAQVTRAVMVSEGGDLAVVFKNGDTLTLPGLMPGVIYPLRATQVLAAGSTATGIKGLI
ncbi:spike base protein, RCAP_Rcc01079 family [Sulfitobacter aestuariivivens]|uniref:Uncharacterized protein n=1 Tax=Sulfitobacter aestuariivivens TaxID=2766981 RepID=A0A927D886_9RHOB|nr:hypothetical protein [Sulfitobacter aestuariivivens]MBD3665387.1 hypothetical protein [Sulfitobacter aestuariivivens]